MLKIIHQLKFDVMQIENKLNSIQNTKIKMQQWNGKPIFKDCEELINKWYKEIEEHKIQILNYSKKLKNKKK